MRCRCRPPPRSDHFRPRDAVEALRILHYTRAIATFYCQYGKVILLGEKCHKYSAGMAAAVSE